MSEAPDIFAAYECLRNDPVQKRFIQVLDLVRESILKQSAAGAIQIEHAPSPQIYLAAIASLTIHRLENKEYDALPEFLRLLHIALGSANMDSTVAERILNGVMPLLDNKNVDLCVAISQISVQLCHHVSVDEASVKKIVEFLCTNALHDDPRLRKAASQAIYDFTEIHEVCFNRLFAMVSDNPLRALTVIRNLAPGMKKDLWPRYFEVVAHHCESPNRAVRVKALQIMSVCLHYLPSATVIDTLVKFSEKMPEAPGEVLIALAELFQSGLTRLAHDDDKTVLAVNFPGMMHRLLLLLAIGDEEAERLIKNTIMYGVQAILALESGELLGAVIEKLTEKLTVQFIGIWKQVYEILSTIPDRLGDQAFQYLRDPIMSSIEKLGADDTRSADEIIGFLVSCVNSMGLSSFFEQTELAIDNEEVFRKAVLPILSEYRGTRSPDDLSFVISRLLPIEGELYERIEIPEMKVMWLNLWNALPNCCRTNLTCENPDLIQFSEFICNRFDSHRELVKPISKIIQVIAPRAKYDAFMITLANASVNMSTASSVVPAIAVVASSLDSNTVNSFFVGLIGEKIIPMARNKDTIDTACALVDVALAIQPFLTEENQNLFYQSLLTFAKQPNHFQKKGLRALRTLIQNHNFPSASDDLLAVLAATQKTISSSTVRYRILLMSTLLHIPGGDKGQMLNDFLPEFVAAIKDTGSKTRAAALAAVLQVASDAVEANVPLSPIIGGISLGLATQTPGFVSSSIEAIDAIVGKFFDRIPPEDLEKASILIWKATETTNASEVVRSALKYAKTLVTRVPKFTEASQLGNILLFGTHCIKKTNWELKGKGHKIIERCMEEFGVEKVTNAFPRDEQKLLRSVRKEFNRDTRKKNQKSSKTTKNDADEKMEFDPRYDEEAQDLLDPRQTISRIATTQDDKEALEFDDRGRLVLKEAPKKKAKETKDIDNSDEEDRGNEVNEHLRMKRKVAKKQVDQSAFVTETGERFKAEKGRGDQQRGQTTPFAYAPLSSKVVNKRYRGQMKAAYKKMFSSKK